MDFLKDLTNEQYQAVVSKNDTLLLAGAGSGKTRVLTYRIAYLIKNGVNPENILAITFTNKASNEMKERLALLIGEENASKIHSGTFHSVCYKWLSQNKKEFGWGNKITIYDSDYQERCFRWATQVPKQNTHNFLKMISSIKNEGYTPSAYEKKLIQEGADAKDMLLSQYYHQYQDEMKRRNAMDFDDLLLYTKVLLQNSLKTKKKLQQQYKHILVDEHQDTNNLQYQILMELKNPSTTFFFVGDDKQSIYSFRGANVENFLNFKKDFPHGSILKLEQNFRSTQNIVQAANELIKNNANQMQMTCYSNNTGKHKIYLKEVDNPEKEAQWIVTMIRTLNIKHQIDFNDISIIYRTNVQSRYLEEQLIRMKIPYVIHGGINFYQREEIKDILAYLYFLNNPNDRGAFSRVIKTFPGIGEATKEKIQKEAKDGNYLKALQTVATIEKDNKPIQNMYELYYRMYSVNKIAESNNQSSVHLLIQMILEKTNYIERLKEKAQNDLKNYRKYMDKIDNIEELLQLSTEHAKREFVSNTLEDFLNDIVITQQQTKENRNGVKLMTVHSSKGLEFEVVFVCGLNEEVFPHKNSFSDPKLIEEERRLMYVALTRAKSILILTSLKHLINRYNGLEIKAKPSRFIQEIPDNYIKVI
ncbi:MAG: ATP-dependent helicase [Ignavibacterium sp.]|nr:ATP-dependent helicase [Ignavibacterium sp.]